MVFLRHAASGLGRCAALTTVAALSTLTLLSAPRSAQAQGYDLSIIARTGDTISGRTLTTLFERSLSFNDNGTVAFVGGFAGGQGIFTQNALLVQSGQTIGGRTLTDVSSVSLNNNGTVAFNGFFSGGADVGIFTQNALLAQSGTTIGGRTLTNVRSPSLSDDGTVAFVGAFSGGNGIFTQNALLAQSGTTIGGRTLTNVFGNPSLNESGTVAFVGGFAGGAGTFSLGIFTQNALLVQSGQTIGGRTLTGGVNLTPSLNNNGTVAFVGAFSGGQGIFTQNALLVQTGQTIGGRTLTSVGFSPLLNNNGTVAFAGDFSGAPGLTETGLFTQSALVAQRGDTIAGRTLTSVADLQGNPTLSLNNNGQMAFRGTLSDGSQAIILATPRADVIPEPGTLALLASGLIVGAGVRRARARRRC